MLNIKWERPCWTTRIVPSDDSEDQILDLDAAEEEKYEFSRENQALANSILGRTAPTSVLHNVNTVEPISDSAPMIVSQIVIDSDDGGATVPIPHVDIMDELTIAKATSHEDGVMDTSLSVLDDDTDEELAASQMTDEDVFVLRECLHGSCISEQLAPMIVVFENKSPSVMQQLCVDLDLEHLSLESTVTIVRVFTKTIVDVSHASCVCFLKATLYKQVYSLSRNGSRSFVGCFTDVLRRFPSAVAEAIILPIWKETVFKTAHVDLITKAIKESNLDFRVTLSNELFRCKLATLSDAHINVITTLVQHTDLCRVSSASLESLVVTLEQNAGTMSKNNRFARLLMIIVETVDAEILATYKIVLQHCVELQETVLKSALETACTKL